MNLYSCRDGRNGAYIITKFDMDMVPVDGASYSVTNATCTCPAGARPTCKHRRVLLPKFLQRGHIGDGWFYNEANGMWHRPVTLADIPDDMPITLAREPASAASDEIQQPLAVNYSEDVSTEQIERIEKQLEPEFAGKNWVTVESEQVPTGFRRRV